MPKKQPAIAKLSLPELRGIQPRDRLFQRLDEYRSFPVIWLHGPPGAGKTSLAVSYIKSRALSAAWYRIDKTDADAAGFFHFLGQLGRRHWRVSLPHLTPEHLSDLSSFARFQFRELFGQMPQGSLLVFDEYQEIPHDSGLHAAMRAAWEEIPAGLAVLVISRSKPHQEFLRMIVNGNAAVIDGETLKLTADEARDLAYARGVKDQEILTQLHETADGWPAGMALLLSGAVHGTNPDLRTGRAAAGDRDMLFGYFAREVVAGLPAPVRDVLMQTSLAPVFTLDMARRITGNADASKVLEWLHSEQLFLTRSADAEPSYRYHALFREFLLAEANRSLTRDQHLRLLTESASALEKSGWMDEAVLLYQEAAEWQQAMYLIVEQAPRLLEQGRWKTVLQWIEGVPLELQARAPWLRFWFGAAQLALNPTEARAILIQAFRGFEAEGDVLGQIASCAAIADSFFIDWSEFTGLDPWIARIEKLLGDDFAFPDPAMELKVLTSTLLAASYRKHGSALAVHCAGRLSFLVSQTSDRNKEAGALVALAGYFVWAHDFERLRHLKPRMQRRIDDHAITALNRFWLRFGIFLVEWYGNGELGLAVDALEAAVKDAGNAGLSFFIPGARLLQLSILAPQAPLERVQQMIDELESVIGKQRPLDVVRIEFAKAFHHLRNNDAAGALSYARRALALAETTGVRHVVFFIRLLTSRILIDLGRLDDVAGELSAAWTALDPCLPTFREFDTDLIMGCAHLRAGNMHAALELVDRALRTAREISARNTILWVPHQIAPVLELALSHGVEVDQAALLVRTHGLVASSPDVENWPWPVRVYCLGRFSVVTENGVVEFNGKAQKMPLHLLKAVIALGGRDVAISRIGECLWPEVDGDAAEQNFAITLHRLRKLLGASQAIVVSERKASLDDRFCWVDAWTFERRAARVLGQLENGDWHGSGKELEECVESIFKCYGGEFLEREADEPWMFSMRTRLRDKLQRLVRSIAANLVGSQKPAAAILTYQRGLYLHPAEESFYRGIMAAYQALGEHSEVAKTYHLCREALSKHLGVAPSMETEALYRAAMRKP